MKWSDLLERMQLFLAPADTAGAGVSGGDDPPERTREEPESESESDDSEVEAEEDESEAGEEAEQPDGGGTKTEDDEDVEIPAWMASLFGTAPAPEPVKPPPREPEKPEKGEDEFFDQDTLAAMSRFVDARLAKEREELTAQIEGKYKHLEEARAGQVRNAVLYTAQNVHESLYKDAFRNDPVMRSSKEAQALADFAAKNFMQMATEAAGRFNNFEHLKLAANPRFGKAVAGAVKGLLGLDVSTKAIKVEGAETVTSAPAAAATAGAEAKVKFTKSELAAMKQFGLTKKQLVEARKIAGHNFEDYDTEDEED